MFFVDFSTSLMIMTGRKYWVHADVLQEHSQVYKATVVMFAHSQVYKAIVVMLAVNLQEHSQVYRANVVMFAVCKSILNSIKPL